jgi:hypothetical protein
MRRAQRPSVTIRHSEFERSPDPLRALCSAGDVEPGLYQAPMREVSPICLRSAVPTAGQPEVSSPQHFLPYRPRSSPPSPRGSQGSPSTQSVVPSWTCRGTWFRSEGPIVPPAFRTDRGERAGLHNVENVARQGRLYIRHGVGRDCLMRAAQSPAPDVGSESPANSRTARDQSFLSHSPVRAAPHKRHHWSAEKSLRLSTWFF